MEHVPEDRHIFYQVLTRKITMLIVIVSFFPMLLTTGILFSRFNGAYADKVRAHISELVQKHTQNIDTFLAEKTGNIRFMAQNFNPRQQSAEAFLKQNLALLKKEYGDVFTDVGLVDDKGIQFAYEGPFNLKNADYSSAQWFLMAQDQSVYISDVFAGLRGHPHFIIAVHLQGQDSHYILRSTINFGAFNSLVENIHLGKTGMAFIVNARGSLQTQTHVDLLPEVIQSVPKPKDFNDKATVFIKKEDNTGREYVCVAAMFKNIDWMMVFHQDLDDAFRDLQSTKWLTLSIFTLGCIAIVFVAFALPRNIVHLLSSADKKSEVMNRQVVESGKLATIGELAAGIAHEINNPVAIMVEEAGWIEDLLEEEDLKQCENLDEFTRALRQINTQGRRCKEITHKLLSFARKTDSTINDVQVNDSIREIVSLTGQMARYNNVIIETRLNEGIPYIRISPSELQQVILNLINNAIDAMEKTGGTISIETKISHIENKHLVIVIQDNGPGIPRDNLARIFDPFFTTKPVGKGTGLGLSICYGIIEKMNGKIDVQSEVGAGTKFRIWIPFQEIEEQTT
ncbi:two-component system, NtrC family, sensor kinase [Desulfocicer vacuolatum DSM 3385]|uniref:histidine kinase n=1 Tax=Desulfocicer vacuolatum DSM 3385 TaxID=1121400 RepID=A0A1W2DQ23_9BACT|nr:PAS domain-containing sensor histidine kinase [Desulfocicer vacuolatum]SMC99580.1 two-component system, NtrC family, sensor kinase [Desulfocicer vacuolatum DSM 3385]